jgi:alkanesulfonate monooxygenase SsuD/methylene tetrahydromethanopterin reductase-like flavin-dependent oxidoreductase (luciferase family)
LKLGVAFGWHSLCFEALLELTQHAEALGYDVAFVDGDVSVIPSLGEADLLDGHTVTTELLARTQRIEVTSLRIIHHWNAARLAQTLATLWRLHPKRVRLFVSIGGQAGDRAFGLPCRSPGERIHWLDEALEAIRALWRGESVVRKGRFVELGGARVRPAPGSAIPIHVAGRGRRLLDVVARHADAWDVNLPAVVGLVTAAISDLERACGGVGRDPGGVSRSLWIFARPGDDPEDPNIHEGFERLNPWFRNLSEADRAEAIVAGSPAECRARIRSFAEQMGLDLPVLDLSGLDAPRAAAALEALAPRKTFIDSDS